MAEVVILNAMLLDGTASTTISSKYDDFEEIDDTWYWWGEKRHSNIADGGNGHDYQIRWPYKWDTGEPRPENDTVHWSDIGYPIQSIDTWTTNATITLENDWVYGEAVTQGEHKYDSADNHDYQALRDLSTSENILRPSSAVISINEDQANYWSDLGIANGFRWLDGEANNRTEKQGQLTLTALCMGDADRLCFAGLRNVSRIDATVSAAEMIPNPSFISPDQLVWSLEYGTCSFAISGGELIFDNDSGAEIAQIKYIAECTAGKAYEISATFTTTSTLTITLESGSFTYIDSDDQGDEARGVYSDGSFIYLANGTGGLHTYSVDGNGILTHIDSDDQGDFAYDVFSDGTFVYLANDTGGLHTYSVDGSGNLTHIDSDDQGDFARSVWGDGTFIYLANATGGLHTYSVDGSGNLTHIDSDYQGGSARNVWGDGTFVYLANDTGGLHTYSVDGSGNLTHIDSDDQGDFARSVWGDGTFVYLANGTSGLRTYATERAASASGTGTNQTITVNDTVLRKRCRFIMQLPAGATETVTVKSVSMKYYNYAGDTITLPLAESSLRSGLWPAIAKGSHDYCSYPKYDITLTPHDSELTVGVGLIYGGVGTTLGITLDEVQSGGTDYSNTKADATYGTRRFLKRGFARRIPSITVLMTGTISGDEVNALLISLAGTPNFWDFNSEGNSIERLMIHGFPSDFKVHVFAMDNGSTNRRDRVDLVMEGVVE